MPEQFVVPQFIDAEDQILGPITARQFLILLVVALLEFVLFKLFSFVAFLVIGIPLFAIGVIVAFAKINGQPFHYFFLNLIQTLRKPFLRVWDKQLSDSELKAYLKKKIAPPEAPPSRKKPLETSRLQELTLVVNTGGVYEPEE